jgi:hypothetical protein
MHICFSVIALMFNSLACPCAVVCSTARGSGVVNSPLTTAEALLRLVRHNAVMRL